MGAHRLTSETLETEEGLRQLLGEPLDAAEFDQERAARYARREGFY